MRIRHAFLAVVFAAALVLALPAIAYAGSIYVSVTGSDATGDGSVAKPYATVQHAVNMAVSGDVVTVGSGTFNGDITMKSGVSLLGNGSANTALTGSGSTPLVTATDIGSGTSISGFTISGNWWGIYCTNSSPTITNNYIGSSINGIQCDNSSPTITANTITNNTGNGIVCNPSSSPTISGNTVSANHVAGILCNSSAPSITDNTISGNWSYGIDCASASSPSITGNDIGGNPRGIRCYGSSSPTITNNTIIGSNPNGIECDNSSPSITGNTISDSTAHGIICSNNSSPSITDNTLSGNEVGVYCDDSSPIITNDTIVGTGPMSSGTGIDCYHSSPTITNVTISENSYGIWCYYSSPTIVGSTVSDNWEGIIGRGSSATITNCIVSDGVDGIGFDSISSPTIVNDTVSRNSSTGIVCDATSSPIITNCIVWNPGATELTDCSATYSDILGGAAGIGNISAEPSFVDSATDDFHLNVASPCIDAGTATSAPSTDKDGVARPQGSGYDMGAYEYFVPPTISLEHDAAGVVFDRFVTGYSTAYSGGGYVYGRWTGTVLKASFTGSSIKWVGPKQPSYGMADVWIDNVKVATDVDCYQASPGTTSATIWQSGTLADGPHTIELRLMGHKNAASTGTIVVLDKFEVTGTSPSGLGTRIDDSTATPGYTGSWISLLNPTYYNKTYRYSKWAGAAFTASFTGTQVSWIGPRTPAYGMADVWIDGAKVATVDCYRANGALQGWREVVWQSGVLSPGAHTISIRPTGTKNPASTAANVVVDAIDVTP